VSGARRLAFAVALLLLTLPLATDAQQAASVPRVGFSVSASAPSSFVQAFRQGLRELGYVEGTNIALEVRYADGQPERFPAFMAEFVRLNVRVIVAGGGLAAARAARRATTTIPIVTPSVADPVKDGLIASMARPGGNLTGLSMMNTEVSGKRVELLKAAVPRLTRVAIVREFIPNRTQAEVDEAVTALRAFGLQSHVVEMRGAQGFDAAFMEIRKLRPDALIMTASSLFNAHRQALVERVAASRLPAIWENREFAAAGGLLSYGPDVLDMYRRAAFYVDKILKGADPADLPVEQPTKFQLVINLKTARSLGLAIPHELLVRADDVIE
jgi:putative ABC transport system substrate-binding protein